MAPRQGEASREFPYIGGGLQWQIGSRVLRLALREIAKVRLDLRMRPESDRDQVS